MRKSTERPLGPDLLTSFPLSSSNKSTDLNAAAPFVDLNDLKLLSDVREKERSAQKIKNMFRKRKSRGFHRLLQPSAESDAVPGVSKAACPDPRLSFPSSSTKHDAVGDESSSPPDSPIVIGMTELFDCPAPGKRDRPKEPQDTNVDAGTNGELAPGTPSIVITPAKEQFWLDPNWGSNHSHPRPTSSVYSQPTPRIGEHDSEIPPVPAVPAFHSTIRGGDTTEDKDRLLDGIPAETSSPARKERSFSTATVFNEDNRSTAKEKAKKTLRHLSINTDTNRRPSQGWWTYLLSPLSGRFDTAASPTSSPASANRPPVPSSIVTSSENSVENWWEKEVSCFSPETPKTETAITSIGETPVLFQEQKERNDSSLTPGEWVSSHTENISGGERTRTQPPFGMALSMSPEHGRMQGAAAEYYQDCAHALFSGDHSFEYVNHFGSTAPMKKVPVAGAQVTDKTDGAKTLGKHVAADASRSRNDGSRGLFVEQKSLPLSHDGSESDLLPTDISHGVNSSTAVSKGKTTTDSPLPRDGPATLDRGIDTTRSGLEQPEPAFVNPSGHYTRNVSVESAGAAVPPVAVNYHIRYPSVAHLPPHSAAPMEKHVPYYILIPPDHYYSEQSKMQSQPPNPTSPGLQQTMEKGGSIPLSDMQSIIPVLAPKPVKVREPRPSPAKEELKESNDEWPSVPLHSTPVPMMTTNITRPASVATTQNNRAFIDQPARSVPAPMTKAESSRHSSTSKKKKKETRRRRHEKEDAVGKKIGGLWRGRGPFNRKGCFGRPGREGRVKRRWYIAIALFFLLILVLAIPLATTLSRKRNQAPPVQSRWLNLTGYPPMPTGIATIAGPEAQVQNSGCISPTSMWSCALPKEGQPANSPYGANQPNFKVDIRFRNDTHGSNNVTTASGSSKTSRMAAIVTRSVDESFSPSPSPPSVDDQAFIGNTTDNNTKPYAGDETPFYISFLSVAEASSNSRRLSRRSTDASFPNLTSIFPPPDLNPDGTAAAANLYPLPSSQPVRLYNRGQPDEHYGFYTYFDRSIFLESSTPLNGSNKDDPPNDGNGGSSIESARTRCTWAQTRFLVQIWTQAGRSGMTLLGSGNSSKSSSSSTGTSTASATSATPTSTATTAAAVSSSASSSHNNFKRPGTFPYPITITLDRHGGTAKKKMVYCYGMDPNEHVNQDEKKLQLEQRRFGGNLVNPAPGIFNDSSTATEDSSNSTSGGIDGGTGGCSCQWVNWAFA